MSIFIIVYKVWIKAPCLCIRADFLEKFAMKIQKGVDRITLDYLVYEQTNAFCSR
jgi:hypothetical protein